MATKTINRGDSLTIDVIIDEDLLSKVEDIWLSVKGDIVAQKTSTETSFIEIDNIFRCQLTSSYTQKLLGVYPIIVSVQWDDLGVRKSFEAESTILNVKQNHNPSNSEAVSSEPDIEIEVTQGDNGLITSVTLATIYRGKNALELFQDEYDLPNATIDDMAAYYYGYKSVAVTNVGDGAVITHNLGGRVSTKLFVTGRDLPEVGVYGQYLNDNQVTLRTPILDDILNQTYTGKLQCQRY